MLPNTGALPQDRRPSAIGYNISTAILGGTTVAVNTFVIQPTGFDLFPAVCLVGAGIVGLNENGDDA